MKDEKFRYEVLFDDCVHARFPDLSLAEEYLRCQKLIYSNLEFEIRDTLAQECKK